MTWQPSLLSCWTQRRLAAGYYQPLALSGLLSTYEGVRTSAISSAGTEAPTQGDHLTWAVSRYCWPSPRLRQSQLNRLRFQSPHSAACRTRPHNPNRPRQRCAAHRRILRRRCGAAGREMRRNALRSHSARPGDTHRSGSRSLQTHAARRTHGARSRPRHRTQRRTFSRPGRG